MTSGWQVICYAAALACFVVATLFAAFVLPKARRPWWKVLVSAGLAFWVLVALWNATALDG
jgi:hypothetical protein